jgi:diguanylate cyclase (GGDEF)-like protein
MPAKPQSPLNTVGINTHSEADPLPKLRNNLGWLWLAMPQSNLITKQRQSVCNTLGITLCHVDNTTPLQTMLGQYQGLIVELMLPHNHQAVNHWGIIQLLRYTYPQLPLVLVFYPHTMENDIDNPSNGYFTSHPLPNTDAVFFWNELANRHPNYAYALSSTPTNIKSTLKSNRTKGITQRLQILLEQLTQYYQPATTAPYHTANPSYTMASLAIQHLECNQLRETLHSLQQLTANPSVLSSLFFGYLEQWATYCAVALWWDSPHTDQKALLYLHQPQPNPLTLDTVPQPRTRRLSQQAQASLGIASQWLLKRDGYMPKDQYPMVLLEADADDANQDYQLQGIAETQWLADALLKGQTIPFIVGSGVNQRCIGACILFPYWQQTDVMCKPHLANVIQQEMSTLLRINHQELLLQILPQQDPVTQLTPYGKFITLIDKEIKRCKRYEHSLSLLLVKIEQFEALNQSLGVQACDQLLHQFAQWLKTVSRSIDTVARVGSNSFALLLPDTDSTNAQFVSLRLSKRLTLQSFTVLGCASPLSLSLCSHISNFNSLENPTGQQFLQAGIDALVLMALSK